MAKSRPIVLGYAPPGLSHLGKGLTQAKPDGTNEGSTYSTDLSHDWVFL